MSSSSEKTPEIIIYETDDNVVKVDVKFEGETVWLSQKQLATIYNTSRPNITMHLQNIFETNELIEDSVCKNFLLTAEDGKKYNTKHYNLDMIISLGYRINSKTATRFRQWATARLSEYIIKGFTMDDDRLKELGGGSYWDELKQRIRDIRASEKVFYRQVLDIYATSIDYDPKADVSVDFFKTVQNKIHYAVHGHTAAEVIYDRVDSEKDYLGLSSFKGSEPTLQEAKVAKNYLDEAELKALGQLVEGYLAFAERQADRKITMTMLDWENHLDSILTSTGEELLTHAGKISHDLVMNKVNAEYKKYQQKTLSAVEKDYLESLKVLQRQLKGAGDKGE